MAFLITGNKNVIKLAVAQFAPVLKGM